MHLKTKTVPCRSYGTRCSAVSSVVET